MFTSEDAVFYRGIKNIKGEPVATNKYEDKYKRWKKKIMKFVKSFRQMKIQEIHVRTCWGPAASWGWELGGPGRASPSDPLSGRALGAAGQPQV